MPSIWPYPRIIAHRGGGNLAPENTLAALHTGHRHGFTGVEFDVMLTADGQPVLMHDEMLDRTTNGQGALSSICFRDVQRLDAGSWYSDRFAAEPVPAFESAAQLCRDLGLLANVEIKPASGTGVSTGRAVAEVARRIWCNAPAPPLLSSFSVAALQAARECAPTLQRALLCDAVPRDWVERLATLDCCALHCNALHLQEPTVHAVRDAGYGLAVWTVNDTSTADRLFNWGANAIFTDEIDLMRRRYA